MAKKSLKTSRQILLLTRYFKQKPHQWPKNQVLKLAKEAGLSRAQVYKWLWDQRNLLRTIQKDQAQAVQLISSPSHYGSIEEKKAQNNQNTCMSQKVRKILLISEQNKFWVEVPEKVEFAVKFKIPKSTPSVFESLLKKYGSELIRVNNPVQDHSAEKKQRLFRISEFNEIKEEGAF